nr:hypothetical protein [uncultured Enterocloster sp.]
MKRIILLTNLSTLCIWSYFAVKEINVVNSIALLVSIIANVVTWLWILDERGETDGSKRR